MISMEAGSTSMEIIIIHMDRPMSHLWDSMIRRETSTLLIRILEKIPFRKNLGCLEINPMMMRIMKKLCWLLLP